MVRLQIRSPPIAGLMMGRVLMWAMVISDSVNLHSFADPRHPPSIIPRQRGHCLHSASIYQSIRTALSLSRQEQIAGSRIAIIGFSVKIPSFHSGSSFTYLQYCRVAITPLKVIPGKEEYFNTRGDASLHLPIKLVAWQI